MSKPKRTPGLIACALAAAIAGGAQSQPWRREAVVLPAGVATVTTATDLKVGDVIATLPVRYRLTGVLHQTTEKASLIGATQSLPAGTPVFGVAMQNWEGKDVVWCAPAPRSGAGMAWKSICFPKVNGARRWIEVTEPFYFSTLSMSPSSPGLRTPFEVDEKPITDAALDVIVALKFNRWTKAGVGLNLSVGKPGAMVGAANYEVGLQADGTAEFNAMGARFRLKAAGDRDHAKLETITPPIGPPEGVGF
jgi:hypothetical protein